MSNFYKAGWQSGYAAACKAVYAGSIPASASTNLMPAANQDKDFKIMFFLNSKSIRIVQLLNDL
jgi:hypothetical protein